MLSRSPWVVQFDAWASSSEVQQLLSDARSKRGRLSQAFAGKQGQLSSAPAVRNSTSYGCSMAGRQCQVTHPSFAPHMVTIRQRLHLARGHADGVNVLRYEPGGFYKLHHDYIPRQSEPQSWQNCGPRQLTFMLYLSDVEGGGATRFPNLGLTVAPRVGRALLWTNVHHAHPVARDTRTAHQAMLVTAGATPGYTWRLEPQPP